MSIFDEGTGAISIGGDNDGPGKYAEELAKGIVEKLLAKRWPKDLAIRLIAEALDTAYSDGFADAVTEDDDDYND